MGFLRGLFLFAAGAFTAVYITKHYEIKPKTTNTTPTPTTQAEKITQNQQNKNE